MPDIPNDFVLWLTLASAAALGLVMMLVLMRAMSKLQKPAPLTVEADVRFPAREPLSLDEFYEEYYSANEFPRTVVLEVLTRFAAATHVPAAVLRPEDSFSTLAEIIAPDREACEQFAVETASTIREAEVRFGANLFSGKLNTLDDYIRTTVLAQRLMAGK